MYKKANFQNENMSMVCPLRIDMYCNNNTETSLHAAVKGKHYDIALALLNAGASSNAIIKAYVDYNEVNLTLTLILFFFYYIYCRVLVVTR